MTIALPEPCLVLLMGVSGSGKSTFAAKHFLPTEVVSSDHCRAMIADDEDDQSVSREAFDLVRVIAGKRLAKGRLTVIDATNVLAYGRHGLLDLAAQWNVPTVVIVLDLPEALCQERNSSRGRSIPAEVIAKQHADLHESLPGLIGEGMEFIRILRTPNEVAQTRVQRNVRPESTSTP